MTSSFDQGLMPLASFAAPADATFSPREIIGWLHQDATGEMDYGTPVLAVRDAPPNTSADNGLYCQIEVPHPFDRRQTVWVTALQSALVPHCGDTTAIWSPARHLTVM